MKRSLSALGLLVVTMLLAACGGGGGGDAADKGSKDGGNDAPQDFSVGGTVSGLADGVQLSLLDNGSNAQTVSNGPFALTATLPTGSAYSVSLETQPTGYQCDVANGSGTMSASNVTDVAISCTPTASVGGSIAGLTSNGLVLANGKDTLSVPANTSTFTMPTPVVSGTTYKITVRRSPTAMRCVVSDSSGTGSSSPVMTVSVSCAPAAVSEIHSFTDLPDGRWPYANVVQGTDGNFYGTTWSGGANEEGTVFMMTPAGMETVLHSFGADDVDGQGPEGDLLRGTDGNLYGTTSAGGAYAEGTVFRITPSGSETVLWSFGDDRFDGRQPMAGLILGADGNFYGTTEQGGANGYGSIFRLTPDGVETVMASFDADNGARRQGAVNRLVQGSDGSLYGVTTEGGGDGTIFKMTLDGTLTTLWWFQGTDGKSPIGKLLLARDGNFYGATQLGGMGGQGTIFKMTPDGAVSTLYSFSGAPDGDCPDGGLIQGSDGNLYGLTTYGGTDDNGTLFKVTLAGTETTLYAFPAAADGSASVPGDSLFEDEGGGLYGITSHGGLNGYGSVFQFN